MGDNGIAGSIGSSGLGYPSPPATTGRCWVCALKYGVKSEQAKFLVGVPRFRYRFAPSCFEKGLHPKCFSNKSFAETGAAKSISAAHIRHSLYYMKDRVTEESLSDELKATALKAIALLRSMDS